MPVCLHTKLFISKKYCGFQLHEILSIVKFIWIRELKVISIKESQTAELIVWLRANLFSSNITKGC